MLFQLSTFYQLGQNIMLKCRKLAITEIFGAAEQRNEVFAYISYKFGPPDRKRRSKD
jgi:hypothetical protein